jgi:hypothetical protein
MMDPQKPPGPWSSKGQDQARRACSGKITGPLLKRVEGAKCVSGCAWLGGLAHLPSWPMEQIWPFQESQRGLAVSSCQRAFQTIQSLVGQRQ